MMKVRLDAEIGEYNVSIALLVIECVLLGVLWFGDIGFDHPGKYGLSFNHAIALMIGYCLALIAGIAFSVSERRRSVLWIQLLIPLLLLAFEFRPNPCYQAPEYQHLVSKSRAEVESQLGTRGAVSGLMVIDGRETEFVAYCGMTIHYSPEGRVIAVIDNGRR